MPDDIQLQLNSLKQDLESLTEEFYRNNFTSSQDFNKQSRFNTSLKVPTLATAPTTCEMGQVYVNSGNGKLYVCSATDTWTIVGTQS